MGPVFTLKSEIERQLLLDLRRAGISSDALRVDWSQIHQDGLFHVRQVMYQGDVCELQEYEGLRLLDNDGSVVADGSYDFVYSGEDQRDPFYVFWSTLEVQREAARSAGIDYNHGIIPDHIWKQLSESNKRNVVNQWENKWGKDPKVVAYNTGTSPFDENVGVGDYAQTNHSIRLTASPVPPKKI